MRDSAAAGATSLRKSGRSEYVQTCGQSENQGKSGDGFRGGYIPHGRLPLYPADRDPKGLPERSGCARSATIAII